MNETLLSSRLAAESRRALAPLQLPVLTVELPSRRVATLLWSMAIGIIAAGAIRQIFLSIYGTHTSAGRLPVFQLGSEFALGDWWGAFQYALAAVLLALCAKSEPDPRWKRYWVALAALFVYLSIDEGVGLHELSATLFAPIDFGGFQHYSWVILYGTVCAVVGLIYLPFVRGLPPGHRGRIILSGAIFLFGVLGLESIEGYCYAYSLKECRLVSVVFEESAEIVGLTLFLVTLFALLTQRASAVTMGLTQN